MRELYVLELKLHRFPLSVKKNSQKLFRNEMRKTMRNDFNERNEILSKHSLCCLIIRQEIPLYCTTRCILRLCGKHSVVFLFIIFQFQLCMLYKTMYHPNNSESFLIYFMKTSEIFAPDVTYMSVEFVDENWWYEILERVV